MSKIDMLLHAYGIWSLFYLWRNRNYQASYDDVHRVFWQIANIGMIFTFIGILFEVLGWFI